MKPKVQKILLLIVVLGIVVIGGGYFGYQGYISARQARLLKQARVYIADSSERKALLSLQRALRYNPKDVEACRLMADLMDAGRSPAALVWRSKVVDLNPHSTDDRLALAQTAMRLRDYASATNALEGVDAAGKKTASYHNIAGVVAGTAGQPVQAEAHFIEAARLEPLNTSFQLNLAVVRLMETNAPALAEARSVLKRLSTNPTNSSLRCQALRELTADAIRHKQADTALSLSAQLLLETNSVFADRILRLGILRETSSAEYKPALANFQREAAGEPAKTVELGAWQMANTSPSETLAWLHGLPQDTQTNQAVAMLTAECYTKQGDWRGLQAFVESQDWSELEFIRHAFKALSLRGQDLVGASKGEWELALKIANSQKGPSVMLLRMAVAWNWRSEAEEILWNIVNRYPDETWAFQALSQALYIGGRTRPLMMLYSQGLKRAPSDLNMKNNVAMMAFLLEANELKPHDLAREVYQKAPTNSSFASTYAFSLHLQEKDKEALKIFLTLTPGDLQDPSVAGYYGLILKATGDLEKARAYLDTAFKAPMLPEEKKMFQQARAGV